MREFIEIAKTITAKEWVEACGLFVAVGTVFLMIALAF